MPVVDTYPVTGRHLKQALLAFPCCKDARRTFHKHNRIPDIQFDPDWTLAECDSCGAVLTLGDYWGQDVLDADRRAWKVGHGQ